MHSVRGYWLTQHAHVLGLKRRWFGLEPDFMLRRRMRATMIGSGKQWPPYLK